MGMVMEVMEGRLGGRGGGILVLSSTREHSRIREVAATFQRRGGSGRGRIAVSQPLDVDFSTFEQRVDDGFRNFESMTALKENVIHDQVTVPYTHLKQTMGKKCMLQRLETNISRGSRGVPPMIETLDKEKLKKRVHKDAKSFVSHKKDLRAVGQKLLCVSMPKSQLGSQASNRSEHVSRVNISAERRPGGRGLLFTRITPLDLSDLEEYFAQLDQGESLKEVEEPEPKASLYRGEGVFHVERDELYEEYDEEKENVLLIEAPDLAKPAKIAPDHQMSEGPAEEILELHLTQGYEQSVQLQARSQELQARVVEEEVVLEPRTGTPDQESQAEADEILEMQIMQACEQPVQLQVKSQEQQEVVVYNDVRSELQASFVTGVELVCIQKEVGEAYEEKREVLLEQQKPIESEEHLESQAGADEILAVQVTQECDETVHFQARSKESQEVVECTSLNVDPDMEDDMEDYTAERVELELSRVVESVELWSVELDPRLRTRESFLVNESRGPALGPIKHDLRWHRMPVPVDESLQASPKSPPQQIAQLLQENDDENYLQELTFHAPNTSPTPPTNPLSIFGYPYRRRRLSVELHQQELFTNEDGRNKQWTDECAIAHLLEHGQEYLTMKSHGDVEAMSEGSASNQEMQAPSECGAQGGTSSPRQYHLVDAAGSLSPVSAEFPLHDIHEVDVLKGPKGVGEAILPVESVLNQIAHSGDEYHAQPLDTDEVNGWVCDFSPSDNSAGDDDSNPEGSKTLCEDFVQSSMQSLAGILSDSNRLESNDQPMASNNEDPLSVLDAAVPECGRDAPTIDMPIDQHAKDQHSNKVTDQAEPKLLTYTELAPAASITEVTPKRQQRKQRQQQRKRKQVMNPLDAGTKWQDGQRVSTRIKSKPLEWWRGERMLYGRVHASLPTLIGIKHYSQDPVWPKARPKRSKCLHHRCYHVDSFVPDEYSEMIRLAAL